MEQHILKALAAWTPPELQALLVPLRTLGSISAMFWMLARLADLLMAVLKRVIFAEAYALLNADLRAAAGHFNRAAGGVPGRGGKERGHRDKVPRRTYLRAQRACG